MRRVNPAGQNKRCFGLVVDEEKSEAFGAGNSLPKEGASIAFVWTWAKPQPCQTHFSGQKPGPTLKRRNDMKDTTFSIRISTEDLETIRHKAKQAHMSQSDYVTRCCLGRQIIIVDGLKDVLKHLRAVGNNLNQLTALANMGRITIFNLDGVTKELAKICESVREISERGRWKG